MSGSPPGTTRESGTETGDGLEAGRERARKRRHRPRNETTRTISRWMYHGHLWLGVVVTVLTLSLAVTGILLNHKRPLGLMPDVEHTAGAPLSDALPLAELVRLATEAAGPAGEAGVDRMDVRPDDGLVKVRFENRTVVEVTLDLHTGEALTVGERNDVFLEKLHSGEIFGDWWILLSDFAAVVLVVLVLSGFWIWLYPKSRL